MLRRGGGEFLGAGGGMGDRMRIEDKKKLFFRLSRSKISRIASRVLYF